MIFLILIIIEISKIKNLIKVGKIIIFNFNFISFSIKFKPYNKNGKFNGTIQLFFWSKQQREQVETKEIHQKLKIYELDSKVKA